MRHIVLVAAAFASMLVLVHGAAAQPANASVAEANTLYAGQSLVAGSTHDHLISLNGRFRLSVTSTGSCDVTYVRHEPGRDRRCHRVLQRSAFRALTLSCQSGPRSPLHSEVRPHPGRHPGCRS
jgi:hypothetical protein